MSTSALRIGLVYTGGRGWIGGEHYIANILNALKLYNAKALGRISYQVILCFTNSEDEPHIRKVFADADGYQLLEIQSSSLRRRDVIISSLNLYIPRRLRLFKPRTQQRWLSIDNIDVLYPFDFSVPISANTTALGWIPDFQPRLLPVYFSENELKTRTAIDDRIVNSATDIVFSSQDSLQRFLEFYPNSRARPHLFHFHPFIAKDVFSFDCKSMQTKYSLPDKYFICCNQFWQHKNHVIIFEALKLLMTSQPEVFVVFTGHTQDSRLPSYFDDLCAMINKLGIRTNIAILGLIPRHDQVQLIRQSIGIIQPSLSEGWSSVVEDSRALGKKIILSDLAVHQEQDPPGAIYFDRTSADSLKKSMQRAWLNWSEGPDPNAEKRAEDLSTELILIMAESFLNIVKQVAPKK